MGKLAPVVFFAFANDRAVERRYLRNLAEEERRVREALDKARRAGRCDVEVRYNATADVVWNVFLDPDFKGRIAVFHFGGHAGGGEILLETPEGASAEVYTEGLAGFLGRQAGLQVVFLNGCSTEPQVQTLLAAGVPAVVATSRAIDDRKATELSAWFYKSLGADACLSDAFDQAMSIVRSQVGNRPENACRSFAPRRPGETVDWPWKLHVAAGEKARIESWKLGGVIGLGGPGGPAAQVPAQVPDLLPYLCDRRPQEGRLDAAISSHRSGLPRRPLAVLLHGDYRQALDRFIDRLQDPTLPHLLSRAPLRRIGPLTFQDPGEGGLAERLGPLQRSFAEKLCGDRGASLAAMASAVAASKSPVMVDVVFSLEAGEPLFGPELLTAWLRDLARWPDLPAGQDLLFLLRFGYHEDAPPSWGRFWKQSPSRKVEGLLSRVAKRRPAGLGVVALPPLTSIEEGDVRLWVEEHVHAFACAAAGADRDSLICERLKEKALELFRAKPSLSMEELAPKLRDQLLECLQSLQEGGA
jgi:CHAT domain